MKRWLAIAVTMAVLAACSDSSSSDTEPIASDALIIDSRMSETGPGVIPCAIPEGQEAGGRGEPLLSGYVNGTPYATPADALRAFVALDAADGLTPPFADSGYIEIRFPESGHYTDGRYLIFGKDFGSGWVTLIGVFRTDEGWAVTWWAASGC